MNDVKTIKTIKSVKNLNGEVDYKTIQQTYQETLKSNAELYSAYGWANVTNGLFATVFFATMMVLLKLVLDAKKVNNQAIEIFKNKIDILELEFKKLDKIIFNETQEIKEQIVFAPLKINPLNFLPKRLLELIFKYIYKDLQLKYINYILNNNIKKNYNSIHKELNNYKKETLIKLKKDINNIVVASHKELIIEKVIEYLNISIEDFKTLLKKMIEENSSDYDEAKRIVISNSEELYSNLNTILDLFNDNQKT